MSDPLAEFAPIRKILVDGVEQPFVVDVEFDGDNFDVEVVEEVLYVSAKLATNDNAGALTAADFTSLQDLIAGKGAQVHHVTDDVELVPNAINTLTGSIADVTLPAASTWRGQSIVVKKRGIAGAVTVTAAGADEIDGDPTLDIEGDWTVQSFTASTVGAIVDAYPGRT